MQLSRRFVHDGNPTQQMPADAGFTLIEVLASLAIMGIFIQLVGSLTGWQIKRYVDMSQSLILDDTARGALNLLRDDAHRAGYGFVMTSNRDGGVFVGDCQPTTYIEDYPFADLNCSKRDEEGESDRLRLLYGDPQASSYFNSATTPSQGPCQGGTETGDYNTLMISANDLITANKYIVPFYNCYIVGGQCEDGGAVPAASTVMCVVKSDPYSANVKGCAYVLNIYYDGRYITANGCTNGWKSGYSLSSLDHGSYLLKPGSKPKQYDLYRAQRNGYGARVAENISQFKVVYGVDLSATADNKLDPCPSCVDDPMPGLFDTPLSWCRDLVGMCGMTLDDGTPLTPETIYSRIIAVHVSFKLYTNTPEDGKTYHGTFNIKNRITR